MTKTRLALTALAALLAAVVPFAGCGGGGSSSGDLASFAPPRSLVYVEGELQPSDSLKSSVDSLAQKVGGIHNLGSYIVTKLEGSAREDGEPFDYAKEVEPWVGEKAGVAFKGLKDGNLTEPVIVVQSTDAEATQEFIDKQSKQSKDPYKDASYEGIDFKVGGAEGNAIGVVDDSLVVAEGESGFKAAVDASEGESLADEARFQDAISAASDGSLVDAYADVGGLIDASGGGIDPQAQEILKNAGIDPSDATAVASIVPGSNQVEVDLSSDLAGERASNGDSSKLIATMPTFSFLVFGLPNLGEQLSKVIDSLDASGIPGQLPPHELKSALSQLGIDPDKLSGSIREAAVTLEGGSKGTLVGALVMVDSSGEAVKTVGDIGRALRRMGVPGVSIVNGTYSGFSVRSSKLGPRPILVVARDNLIAVGTGLYATLTAINPGPRAELSDGPKTNYDAAAAALGDTPVSLYLDGPHAIELAESLVPRSKTGFWEALPYLKKIGYIVAGTGTDGELATTKLIVGLEK